MSTVLFRATCCTGSTWGHLHSQLCEVVSQTAIGNVLGSVGEAECEEFFQYYLHDFVRSIYQRYHKQQKPKRVEYKVQTSYTFKFVLHTYIIIYICTNIRIHTHTHLS